MAGVPANNGLILMMKNVFGFKNAIANDILGEGIDLYISTTLEGFIWSIKPII